MFDNLGVSLTQVQGGKLKLLGVATPKRMASLPDVPTIAETLPGFEATAWFAVVAPPGTPKQIVEKINADINEALARSGGGEAHGRACRRRSSAAARRQTAKYFRSEVDRWHKVIKAANVKME